MYRPIVFVGVQEDEKTGTVKPDFVDAETFADLCIAIWRSRLEARGLSVPTQTEDQEPPEIYQDI